MTSRTEVFVSILVAVGIVLAVMAWTKVGPFAPRSVEAAESESDRFIERFEEEPDFYKTYRVIEDSWTGACFLTVTTPRGAGLTQVDPQMCRGRK